MAHEEIDSFVRHFKSLLSAGHNATTLNVECKLGEVNVALSCKVDCKQFISVQTTLSLNNH